MTSDCHGSKAEFAPEIEAFLAHPPPNPHASMAFQPKRNQNDNVGMALSCPVSHRVNARVSSALARRVQNCLRYRRVEGRGFDQSIHGNFFVRLMREAERFHRSANRVRRDAGTQTRDVVVAANFVRRAKGERQDVVVAGSWVITSTDTQRDVRGRRSRFAWLAARAGSSVDGELRRWIECVRPDPSRGVRVP